MKETGVARQSGRTFAEKTGRPRVASMTRSLMGLCLILSGSFGCAGPLAGEGAPVAQPTQSPPPAGTPPPSPPSPPAPPPQAAESWRNLRLRLSPPGDPADTLARELTFALETALVQAGFQLVLDPAAPVDARLEVASALHSVGVAVHGTAFVAVEGDGILVDRVATQDGFYRRDRFAAEAARELLTALLASPRMAAFASRHGPRPAPTMAG